MGMFDIFTNPNTNAATQQPAQQPAQQQPVTPGNLPPGAGATDPNNPHAPVAPKEPESPLAQYEKLWEDVPVDPNAPAAPPAPVALTAEEVQKAVAKANFAQAITPEQIAAINAGGEGATAAFQEAMNTVAQQVMVQATLVGNKLTDKAVADALKLQEAKLPQMLREQATTSHLTDTNPIFDNPAVQPIIEITKAQLLQKHPNATPAEITQMTQNYILAMGEAFAPTTTEPSDGNEYDFSNFA